MILKVVQCEQALWFISKYFANRPSSIVVFSSGDNSLGLAVKTEGASLVKTCLFDDQLKTMAADPADSTSQPSKRQEVTPMEVSSNPPPTDVFKVQTLFVITKGVIHKTCIYIYYNMFISVSLLSHLQILWPRCSRR